MPFCVYLWTDGSDPHNDKLQQYVALCPSGLIFQLYGYWSTAINDNGMSRRRWRK